MELLEFKELLEVSKNIQDKNKIQRHHGMKNQGTPFLYNIKGTK